MARPDAAIAGPVITNKLAMVSALIGLKQLDDVNTKQKLLFSSKRE
jgi:hypothetical protein